MGSGFWGQNPGPKALKTPLKFGFLFKQSLPGLGRNKAQLIPLFHEA
jgi:hypothetical protein